MLHNSLANSPQEDQESDISLSYLHFMYSTSILAANKMLNTPLNYEQNV